MVEQKIYKGDTEGKIVFKDGILNIHFPDKKIKKEIKKYFNTEMEFNIPQSNKIDDFIVRKVKPILNEQYFEQAVCELSSNVEVSIIKGVSVDEYIPLSSILD